MKTLILIFDDEVFEARERAAWEMDDPSPMERANNHFDLPQGAWFGPEDGQPPNTYKWFRGNFFD